MKKVVFILADKRSGSTLLDQLLGAHPRVTSLGEVIHLRAYATQDRTGYDPVHPLDCSCGKRIEACEFWSATQERLGRPLADLNLTIKTGRSFRKFPRLFPSFLYRNVGRDSMALYDATGADYLIDSSKDIFRFRAVYDYAPDRVIPLVLSRDYRAVAHSKQKRGRSLKDGVTGWTCTMRYIQELTRDIPTIRVRYEDLCKNPRIELDRILMDLDLDFSEDCLTRPEISHHIGGSPSKLDPTKRQIRFDSSYLSAFTDTELSTMKGIAGPIAARFGYT